MRYVRAPTFGNVRPPHEHLDSAHDVLSEKYESYEGGERGEGQQEDVRARWAASAAQAASRAYTAAYGREIADDSTRMRWRLEPRVAVTAAIVLILLGVGAWWASSSPPTLPAHADSSAQPGASAEPDGDPKEGLAPEDSADESESAEPVIVHVSGEVAQPGLVTLELGDRVADAVEQAGGIVGEADLAAVNLARLAQDGEQIHVPAFGEAPAPGAASGQVNLNTADAAGLETLPGIGPVLAERIIKDRETHGPFASLEDLARVSGVGDAMVSGLADLAHA